MSALEIAEEIEALPADEPLDWIVVSQRINDEFAVANSFEERGELLAVRAGAIEVVVHQLQLTGEHLEKFIDACDLEYKRLIVQETLIGKGVSAEKMLAVTDREVAAGRMSDDYALRELAKMQPDLN
jgi:hypothetical protein